MKLSAYIPFALAVSACTIRIANSSTSLSTNINQKDMVSVQKSIAQPLQCPKSSMHNARTDSTSSIPHFLEFSLIAGIFISAIKACAYNKSIHKPSMKFKP